MSVKSTVYLTRAEAERRYLDLWLQDLHAQLTPGLAAITDADLERRIELMNDNANDGEGYENYIIRGREG